MDDVIFQLEQYKNQKMPFVLCIVTETEGSTPRKAGAKMLVFADGTINGTVGGGAIEKKAVEMALQVLKGGLPQYQSFELEDDVGMICGGRASIYFEPIKPQLSLYIFGAGHVGREVGSLAYSLGFNVCFVDNRPEIYKEFESSYADCLTGDYLEMAASLSLKPNDFVLITTQGHAFDGALLEALAPKELLYLGMIGSKRKVGETTEKILAGGKVTREQLTRVDMPVGIPIKAETPREIAISIVAKLIDVRNLNKL
ncbi:MAG TPA: XdhC family protein [Bacteroidales bacterium]|nr:XdhC family protein [Bacteroidales bacterium]